MSSNEHPDMSGNWADAPILCEHCGEPVRDDRLFGCPSNDELSFCSEDCVWLYEDAKLEELSRPGELKIEG